MEGYFVLTVIFGTALLAQSISLGYFPYALSEVLWSLLASVLSMTGSICVTIAFQSGNGGSVQAIDSLKMLVPLILDLLFFKVVPTAMQLVGIIFSIAGALVISCMKSSPTVKDNDEFKSEN